MQTKPIDTTTSLTDGRIKYTRTIQNNLHYHRQIELIYLLQGSLRIETDRAQFVMQAGELAILRPLESHRLVPLADNRYLLIILPDRFSLRLSSGDMQSRHFRDVPADVHKLLGLHRTMRSLTPPYQDIFYECAAQIVRNMYAMESACPSNAVLDYIRAHYREPITLNDVASACTSNRTYVSKTVNDFTGRNFNDYVNRLRITYFLDLYNPQENRTIEAVARECGFTSPRTFYRAFAQELHCSPKAYFHM